MNEIIDCAVKLLNENKTALLTTIMEENYLDSRLVGPFVNDGLTVYIFTLNNSNKIKQIISNSHISLYLQENYENIKEYKSLLINGEAYKVSSDEEILNVMNRLEIRSRGYKEWIDKDGCEKWSIIKIQPKSIKYIDNSKWNEPQLIKIQEN